VRSRLVHILACCLGLTSVRGQELQFTQFYATPMFLNPAFAGLTYEHRFSASYRRQWPGIMRSYTTYMAAYDYNISDLNSGIGGFVIQDVAGTSNLTTTQGGGNFAYSVKLTKTAEIRGGMMVAMTQKKLDNTRLIFNDQLITGSANSSDYKSEKVNYLDMGAGALYNSTNYWLGVSARHINQPNASLLGNIEVLPVYLSVHAGYRYIIAAQGSSRSKLDEFVSASVHFRKEQRYDQFDIGAYYFKSFLNVGLWYRGLPFKKYKPGFPGRESIAVLLGLEIPDKNFRVGYSYDITVSRLGISNTQGSHELSLIYEVARKRKKTRRVLVSCPKF
jgi:type IX secretion system PorP/SprF family membrane protein